MDPASTTPLLCAGITMFSPLRRWNVGPGSRVAVVGMGGLGHVGVKLAAAMGAEVTVFSQSTSKEADGRRFGASGYFATAEDGFHRAHRDSFDLILNTVSVPLDVGTYVKMLRPEGTLVMIGAGQTELSIAPGLLISRRKSISGSLIGGIPETQEMIDFCAEHGVAAEIELISADQINDAYDRVVASDVRYRFVIDAKTF